VSDKEERLADLLGDADKIMDDFYIEFSDATSGFETVTSHYDELIANAVFSYDVLRTVSATETVDKIMSLLTEKNREEEKYLESLYDMGPQFYDTYQAWLGEVAKEE
jgi:hypothetical protein